MVNSDDKFNVGVMGLFEWKNLFKFLKFEVVVIVDLKYGNFKLLGVDGSKMYLFFGESFLLDNFIVVFGDVVFGLEKKEDLDYVYDNLVVMIEDGLLVLWKEDS